MNDDAFVSLAPRGVGVFLLRPYKVVTRCGEPNDPSPDFDEGSSG